QALARTVEMQGAELAPDLTGQFARLGILTNRPAVQPPAPLQEDDLGPVLGPVRVDGHVHNQRRSLTQGCGDEPAAPQSGAVAEVPGGHAQYAARDQMPPSGAELQPPDLARRPMPSPFPVGDALPGAGGPQADAARHVPARQQLAVRAEGERLELIPVRAAGVQQLARG